MSQDLFDDTWVVDEADDTNAAAALGASQGINQIDLTNEARPSASAEVGRDEHRRLEQFAEELSKSTQAG